jgi:hypothetical protein
LISLFGELFGGFGRAIWMAVEEDLDVLFRGCFYDSRELLEELFEELFGDF